MDAHSYRAAPYGHLPLQGGHSLPSVPTAAHRALSFLPAPAVLHTGSAGKEVWAELQPAPPADQAKTHFGKPECDGQGSTQLAQAGPAAWGSRCIQPGIGCRGWLCAVCAACSAPSLSRGAQALAVLVWGKDQPELWQPALPKPASMVEESKWCGSPVHPGYRPCPSTCGIWGQRRFGFPWLHPADFPSRQTPPGQTCLKPKLEMSSNIMRWSLAERDLPEALHRSGLSFFHGLHHQKMCDPSKKFG